MLAFLFKIECSICWIDFWPNRQCVLGFYGSYFDQTQSQDILMYLNIFISSYFSNVNSLGYDIKKPASEHRSIAKNKHKVKIFYTIARFSKANVYSQ